MCFPISHMGALLLGVIVIFSCVVKYVLLCFPGRECCSCLLNMFQVSLWHALCVSPETEVLSNSPERIIGICASADFYFISLTVYRNALQVNSVILWEVMQFSITPQKMCLVLWACYFKHFIHFNKSVDSRIA